jgi:hypothetical protein
MVKTEIYLRGEELAALRALAKRSGRSIASLVREAVQERWLAPERRGPVAIWNGPVRLQSSEHDRLIDHS